MFTDVAEPPAANTPSTPSENRVRYPALDGVRAVALVMVFAQHYRGMPWGYTGVDLFFVLSGFLITGILFDSVDRPDRWRTFFLRRSLRIFPLYYGLFAVLLLLTPVMHLHWSKYWLVWPTYLGNVMRFVRPYSQDPALLAAANGWLSFGDHGKTLYLGHFWSLCLEEQFYLAWPLVVFSVRERRKLMSLCAVVVLTWPLLRVWALALLPARYTQLELTYSFTPLRIDALLIGGLLALLIRGGHRDAVLKGCRWIAMAALPLIAVYLAFTVRPGQPYPYPASRLTWGQSVVDLVDTALIGVALIPGTLVYRLCNLRWLRKIGQISYGAYVFHDIPHNVYVSALRRASPHISVVSRHFNTSLTLLAAIGTLVMAGLSFRYIESPILSLKERWAPSG